MKQRTVIAASIALEPRLVIADEPTTALDVTIQKLVLQTLLRIEALGCDHRGQPRYAGARGADRLVIMRGAE